MTIALALYDRLVSGTIGNWFSIIGVLSLMYWAWRIIAATRAHLAARKLHAAAAPAETAATATLVQPQLASVSESVDHIAVIAAAVHAVLGGHRIVHIEADDAAQPWVTEGRWMQQTSHRPR